VSFTPLFGSTIGQIFHPLYEALAWMIAIFYAFIPNYAVAIGLLTVAVMIITSPLTVKSTRSTIAMQRLAPEMKKLQAKYKGDRVTLNEEMMKLYKEHGVNPAGGCLPLIVQAPVFIVLYGVIRGLTHTVTIGKTIKAEPDYISKSTRLYKDLVASNGHMKAFGIDLANNLFSHHSSWVLALPYGGLVAVAIALQYLQMRQLNNRNPAAAQANPQVQMMQKYMPLVFAIIYLRISAGVNIYFVVSSLCRIGIQEAIFRSGLLNKPTASRAEVLPSRGGTPGKPKKKTFMEKLADMQQQALEQQRARQAALQADAGIQPTDAKPDPATPTKTAGTDSPSPGSKPTSAKGGSKPAPSKAPGTKPAGTKPPGSKQPNGAGPNGAKPVGAGNGSGPNGAGAPGAKARGQNPPQDVKGPDAPGNGAGDEKTTQSRSAKKRERKAR